MLGVSTYHNHLFASSPCHITISISDFIAFISSPPVLLDKLPSNNTDLFMYHRYSIYLIRSGILFGKLTKLCVDEFAILARSL